MPREQRKIIFASDEIFLAVTSYARMATDFLPKGKIVAVGLMNENEISLNITVETNYGNVSTQVEIIARQVDVVELFIRACLENNIPIPRRAAKHLQVISEELALVIDLHREEL